VRSRYGDIIEQTKTHGPTRLGVMARWAHATNGPLYFILHNHIDRQNSRACGMIGRIKRMRIHGSVWIEHGGALFRALRCHPVTVLALLNSQQLLWRGGKGVNSSQVIEQTIAFKLGFDSFQTLGAFGVKAPHIVLFAAWMSDESNLGHGLDDPY